MPDLSPEEWELVAHLSKRGVYENLAIEAVQAHSPKTIEHQIRQHDRRIAQGAKITGGSLVMNLRNLRADIVAKIGDINAAQADHQLAKALYAHVAPHLNPSELADIKHAFGEDWSAGVVRERVVTKEAFTSFTALSIRRHIVDRARSALQPAAAIS